MRESGREAIIKQITDRGTEWDLVIIGGGASGLGAALESVSRGYSTLLLEQHDFAKGTSSRSTKLIHGGVRYLAQGNIPLVLEALRERGRLQRNAPHLVKSQGFVIPCYSWWCVPFYTIGLTLYDIMAGKLGIGRSVPFSKKRTIKALPSIKSSGLQGGVRYYDCQFDDSRLAINLCQTIQEQGGVVLNYAGVTGILKKEGRISGVKVSDAESGKEYEIRARGVINATGVFVDNILKMDDPRTPDVVKPSQGIHIVLDRKFMNGEEALMIPNTSDGRVLFAVPWHNKLVVGTTDVEKHEALLEPHAEEDEIEYILETAGRYMVPAPLKGDILSLFTGLRPLAASTGEGKKTKEISRGHRIMVSGSGLVTIIGGKWTTYRKMAEDVVSRVARFSLNSEKKSQTKNLKIHGYQREVDFCDPFYWYGSDYGEILKMVEKDSRMGEKISESLNIIKAQVVWSVCEEMARTVEDFLSRRTRAIQLDARESIRIAPIVAEIMAGELGNDRTWVKSQADSFTRLASNYILSNSPKS
ncbi:MAG: glycerol-3-phosphate dehydrogenase/oxidase [Bacteroidetes bacterium]|nr:glycerol-3-phosphate dehydrogenase/oxidase [Bacteroidota bacterium]